MWCEPDFLEFPLVNVTISPNQRTFFSFVFSGFWHCCTKDPCSLNSRDSWFIFEDWWLALDSHLNFADTHMIHFDLHFSTDDSNWLHMLSVSPWNLCRVMSHIGGIWPPPPSLWTEYLILCLILWRLLVFPFPLSIHKKRTEGK